MGALITAFGALYAAHVNRGKDHAREQAQLAFYKELSQKNEEIARLSHELLGNVTGGKGYLSVDPQILAGNRGKIYLRCEGKYPLRNVKVLIQDLHKVLSLYNAQPAPRDFGKANAEGTIFINRGDMSPRDIVEYDILLPYDKAEYILTINVNALNRLVTHMVAYKKNHDGVWVVGSRTLADNKFVACTGPRGIFPDDTRETDAPIVDLDREAQ